MRERPAGSYTSRCRLSVRVKRREKAAQLLDQCSVRGLDRSSLAAAMFLNFVNQGFQMSLAYTHSFTSSLNVIVVAIHVLLHCFLSLTCPHFLRTRSYDIFHGQVCG